MDLLLALISGFTLGCLHAFDIDHVTAVSALVSHARKTTASIRLGITWGLGHSATLLVLGGVIVLFRLSIPEVAQIWAEILVGILLVALGAWTLHKVSRDRRIHIHRHAHDGQAHVHIHSHAAEGSHDHQHQHSMFAIGAAHGLAGTGSVVLLIPVAFATQPMTAIVFLLLFGVGTMIAMGIFSWIFSVAMNATPSERILHGLRATAGIASVAVGFLWITERLF